MLALAYKKIEDDVAEIVPNTVVPFKVITEERIFKDPLNRSKKVKVELLIDAVPFVHTTPVGHNVQVVISRLNTYPMLHEQFQIGGGELLFDTHICEHW